MLMIRSSSFNFQNSKWNWIENLKLFLKVFILLVMMNDNFNFKKEFLNLDKGKLIHEYVVFWLICIVNQKNE